MRGHCRPLHHARIALLLINYCTNRVRRSKEQLDRALLTERSRLKLCYWFGQVQTNISSTINAYRPEATSCCKHHPRNPFRSSALFAYLLAYHRRTSRVRFSMVERWNVFPVLYSRIPRKRPEMSESPKWKYPALPRQSRRQNIATTRSRSAHSLVGTRRYVHVS